MSDPVETARVLFEAFNRQDREAMKRLTSEDLELVPLRAALEGTVYRGHEGLERFWDATEESWSELSIEVEGIEQGTEAVFVVGRIRGHGRETGIPVEMELGFAVGVSGDEVTRMVTYTDIGEACRAAGVEG